MPDQVPTKPRFREWVATNFGKALIATVVGVLVGGTLTLLVNRPSPKLLVQSVGFATPHHFPNRPHARVEIPEDLRKTTEGSGWVKDLKRFEPFEQLLGVDAQISETLLTLDDAEKNLSAWRSQYAALLKTAVQLPKDTLESHPFFVDDTYIASLIGEIAGAGIGAPTSALPEGLEAVLDGRIVASGENRGMYVPLPNKWIKIPTNERDSENQIAEKKALYEALLWGDTAALEWYSDRATSDIVEGAGTLRKLQDSLRSLLVPASTLQIRLIVYNSGGRPITFQPWFSAELLHREEGALPIHLVYPGEDPGRNPFALTSGGFTINMGDGQPSGSDYQIAPFLTPSVRLEYVTAPAGEFVEVSLIGVAPLGERASDMKALLDTGVLEFRVRGKSTADRIYTSDPYQFTYQPDDSAFP